MTLSDDYGNIASWNQKTQASPVIDPNTCPITPPHSHLQPSQTEISMWEDNAAPSEPLWEPDLPGAFNAKKQGDIQEGAMTTAFAEMNLEHGGDRPRRRREYGMLCVFGVI